MLNKILSGIKQDNNKETFEAAELAKLYHNVIHSARVGIAIIHGKDMVVSTVNEACLEIWGADKSVIGQSLYHSLPDLMAQAAHILEEIYDTGKPFVGNEIPYVVNRNGEKKTGYFDFVWQPRFDDDGKVEGITAIATEVTERALANKQTKESQDNVTRLFSQAPVAIQILKGPDLVIELINDLSLINIQRTREEVLGRRLIEVFPELEAQGFMSLLKQVYETGERFQADEQPVIIIKNGEPVQYYTRFVYEPFRNAEGIVEGVMVIGEDITQLVLARQQLELKEKELSQLISQAPLAILLLEGKDLVMRVINKFALELTGKTLPEMINRPVEEVFPNLQHRIKLYKQVYETGTPIVTKELPISFIRNNNPYTGLYNLHYSPWYNLDNSIAGVMMVGIEVTDTVNARNRIEENQQQFQHLANTMPQVVWMARADGLVFYYNDRIAMYSGATKLPDGRWQWEGLVHPDEIAQTDKAWKDAVAYGNVYEMEHRLMMKDGEYRWHLSRAVPQKNKHSEILSWFGTATDIHQQKTFSAKLEAEVLLRTAELQQANTDLTVRKKLDEKKDEFISIASHELKTPLTIAQGFLQLASNRLKEHPDSGVYAMIEKTNRALKRLNNIIEDFLDVSRMHHGQLQLHHVLFEFNSMLEESVDFIKTTYPSRTVTLNGLCEEVMLYGDSERLSHVCSNLLNNAIKYSGPGQPVEVNVSKTTNELLVEIKDQGLGIAPEDIPFVFDRYFRVQDISKTHTGMGIGLFLSAEIIRKHNGKIWVTSQKGIGSSFYFSVPLTQDASEQEP